MQQFVLKRKNHLMVSGGALIALGFFSAFVLKNETAAIAALASASVLGALPIAIQAYQSIRLKIVSIDVLVTIAVSGAFALRNFEESAIVTFLFLFGAYLEQRTLTKTRSAIKELTEMAPESALKQMDDGLFVEVPIEEVEVGDVLQVKTGARFPVDGSVASGEGHVDEASITGESLPVGKTAGSSVYAGTILVDGTLRIVAERVGEDTTFDRIIELVEEAQDSKSEAERFIDRFSKYYTPAVLLLSVLVWAFTRDVELSITILVLGCPGALVIGVPVSNVAGIGNGARSGILLKGSEVIHDFSRVDAIVFDKTGTLTTGKTRVAEARYYGGAGDSSGGVSGAASEDFVRSALASVEAESDHPLAKAIVDHLGDVPRLTVEQTSVVKGLGITATVDGRRVAVGNARLMDAEGVLLDEAARADIDSFSRNGNSLVLAAIDGRLLALMGIRDTVRPGVREDLHRLKKLGIRNLVVLSGDTQETVDLVAGELGLTEAHGRMLPEDKSDYIAGLKEKGLIVAFVGDGVNDSPSLAIAHIGIAMGGGTDVAIETSDVVLMNSDFGRLPHALGLARATARNMKQNIAIAVGVVVLLISSLIFSEWMNMSVGMFVHEASILVVILNGMRLLRYKTSQ